MATTVFLGSASRASSYAENPLAVAILTSSPSERQKSAEKRRKMRRA
jgi:hypothetical protein